MKRFQNTILHRVETSNKYPKSSDNSTESYFFQPIEADENPTKSTIYTYTNSLDHTDIHGHILSFLDQKNLVNIRLINKPTNKFVCNNINKSLSIRLTNANQINGFVDYFKDIDKNKGEDALLKNINILSLNINSVNVSINKFQQLIEQLEKATIINLHLKIEHITNFAYIEYLANSGMRNLTTLGLKYSDISDDGAIALANGNLNSLTKLNLSGCRNNFDYRRNPIGIKGFTALSNGNLSSLTALDLSCNIMDDECPKVIANGNLSNLTKLNLRNFNVAGLGGISNKGAIALANGNLNNLTTLDLAYNEIGNEGATAIANGNLSRLVTLRL
ncbi:MAG: hypothetical protein ACK5Z5_04005 [Neisseriaceae bacterium]|jgi:uncharacterized protein YlaI